MIDSTDQKKAVIYCRVSSTAQTTRGDGLGSQETRCREYAKHKGYVIEEIFKDDMSGSVINRPGMQTMLKHLRKYRREPRVVLIDDISRLARGVDAHLQLRNAIANAGATLESPSIEFGEDSDSILVENLLASVSQHQRQKNSEQTVNRMRSRMLNGYSVFQAPVGYKYQRISGQGNTLVRDEPVASIIQEALEGYASGRFQIQAEVKRFLESFPEYPKDGKGEVRSQQVNDMLTRTTYAGYIEAPEWNVSLRPGQHQGLIDFETYQKIQERLQGKAYAPARKNLNEDFPLRGFVVCGDCDKPLTACWSKGRNKKHPYYYCVTKGCESRSKSIRRDVLEGDFEALLHKLSPSKELFKMASKMFEQLWKRKAELQKDRSLALKAELLKIDRKVEQLLDRIVNAGSPTVVSAYEQRIQKLEKEKIEMGEKIAKSGKPVRHYRETLRTAMEFLSSPHKRKRSTNSVLKISTISVSM